MGPETFRLVFRTKPALRIKTVSIPTVLALSEVPTYPAGLGDDESFGTK